MADLTGSVAPRSRPPPIAEALIIQRVSSAATRARSARGVGWSALSDRMSTLHERSVSA